MDNTENVAFIHSDSTPRKASLLFGVIDIRDRSIVPLQVLLFVFALLEVWQGVSNIIWPGDNGDSHTYSHLGSYSLAYASVLLVIACRPARARAFLILVSVAALGFLITSILDISRGNAELAGEIHHLTKLIAPFVVWIIAIRIIAFSRFYK